jgi:deoxycytidine triphosphate deaminase
VSPSPLEDYPNLAGSDEEAARRFNLTKSSDPFPEIQSSLLNSADIYDYVRMTGMLYPFNSEPTALKSASYLAPIRGRCIWWDDGGKQYDMRLEEGKDEELVLGPNSITFVQIEPYLRLPDYIALRFNLKITHVHRGILLGTGPLVDPGFVGQLLIPLHNLTPNTYRLGRREGLIWIEFTKTSEIPLVERRNQNTLGLRRRGKYIPFPTSKNEIQPLEYLRKASPQSPVRSSIPEAILKSRDQAEKATKTVKVLTGIGILGLVALTITTWALIHQVWKVIDEVRHQLISEAAIVQEKTRKTEELEKQLGNIKVQNTDKFSLLQEEVDRLKVGSSRAHIPPGDMQKQPLQGARPK